MRPVELYTMIRIREDLHVVVVDIPQIQLVDQNKGILKMDIVVGNTVHDQKSDTVA